MTKDKAVAPPKAGSISAVLSDKNGTLIHFNSTWRAAFEEVALDLSGGDADLASRLLVMGGWDEGDQRFLAGSLCAAASTRKIADAWATLLPTRPDAGKMADSMDRRFALAGTRDVKAVTALLQMFRTLKARGIALGIATSDSEQSARSCMRSLDALALPDFVAGYDSGHGRKPEPGMVRPFFSVLGLEPAKVAVVGDNGHDMEMGRHAGVDLLVGVLSGTGLAADLEGEAHHLLPDISHLAALLEQLG